MYPEAAPMAVVKRTIRVAVPIEKAFQVFVEKMGAWWPATHHIAKEPFQEIVVEPHEGGRWFERDSNGIECDWGRVLLWEPPRRLILSWHLQPDWTVNLDPSRASEVAMLFVAEHPSATRLEFEHRFIERHGEGYEKLFAGVDSPGGWTAVLGSYEQALK
jgi:uncharacterized protein YndB with AHSA1/START domain